MLTLNPKKLADLAIPIATGWLLGAYMGARGKQDLWIRQKPEVLEVLREQAVIQSVESSNRIEGITVAADHLRPLAIGRAGPCDGSEAEMAAQLPAVSSELIKKVLAELKKAGQVRLAGRGRGARWELVPRRFSK